MLLIARIPEAPPADEARRALELLLAQPGCRRGLFTRSTESEAWVLTVEFESISAYRRALSPFEVRTHVIPFLARADSAEPGAYEIVLEADGEGVREHASLLAADAATVRLGEAGGPATAR